MQEFAAREERRSEKRARRVRFVRQTFGQLAMLATAGYLGRIFLDDGSTPVGVKLMILPVAGLLVVFAFVD
jgi:hypothetical protein